MVTFLFAVHTVTEAKPGHLTWFSPGVAPPLFQSWTAKSNTVNKVLVEFLVFLLQIILCLI